MENWRFPFPKSVKRFFFLAHLPTDLQSHREGGGTAPKEGDQLESKKIEENTPEEERGAN